MDPTEQPMSETLSETTLISVELIAAGLTVYRNNLDLLDMIYGRLLGEQHSEICIALAEGTLTKDESNLDLRHRYLVYLNMTIAVLSDVLRPLRDDPKHQLVMARCAALLLIQASRGVGIDDAEGCLHRLHQLGRL